MRQSLLVYQQRVDLAFRALCSCLCSVVELSSVFRARRQAYVQLYNENSTTRTGTRREKASNIVYVKFHVAYCTEESFHLAEVTI